MNQPEVVELVLAGEEATENLGMRLGKVVSPGVFIDLRGDLGSGKTTFVRGLAQGMELSTQVRSPTFVIATLHEGQIPLLHVDAYRLDQQEELALHGWSEWAEAGVIAAEWAGRIEGMLPRERLQLSFETVDEGHRRVRITLLAGESAPGSAYLRCMESLVSH
ncbi:MAG: tRNA (adenosine(37)-N6)-threonylcarbamoyltransferase complex ATPase subunit type 1 TsaE [Planctomycetia bacterium TMED53]|nr:MAG: tRNA (adenosine(37)-N6)-threonylcarbamoyltransferase complex ATPase subunit type 1 TsaE [Planctomycetia bacterium TMED53]